MKKYDRFEHPHGKPTKCDEIATRMQLANASVILIITHHYVCGNLLVIPHKIDFFPTTLRPGLAASAIW